MSNYDTCISHFVVSRRMNADDIVYQSRSYNKMSLQEMYLSIVSLQEMYLSIVSLQEMYLSIVSLHEMYMSTTQR